MTPLVLDPAARRARYPAPALFVAGGWRAGGSGRAWPVLDPSTEEPLAELALASAADLDDALAAAAAAFPGWRAASPLERSRVLRGAAALMRERREEQAVALALEQGKTLADARFELEAAAEALDWHAEEGRRIYGRVIAGRTPGVRQTVLREPVGVVAAFTPWNFPALTPARKIAAALAAGCTMVLKGAEESPATLCAVVRCLAEAGLPEGALNLVFGVPHEVSERLLASPAVRKLSFTGSIPVGRHLATLAAGRFLRTGMELGGHAPVLVFDDVDPARAAEVALAKKTLSSGQNCISPTRFLVQERAYPRFVERAAELLGAVRVGDPLDPAAGMGPVSNRRRLEALERLVAGSAAAGARVAAGGGRLGNRGFFFAPTLLADAPGDAPAMREEPFGPLVAAAPFRAYEEAVARANALEVGLAAYAFTSSDRTALRLSEDLQAGMVGINHMQVSLAEAPFGGVKESGMGRENGMEGVEAYLETKFVAHRGWDG